MMAPQIHSEARAPNARCGGARAWRPLTVGHGSGCASAAARPRARTAVPRSPRQDGYAAAARGEGHRRRGAPVSGGRRVPRGPAAGRSATVRHGRETCGWVYWAGCVGLSGPKRGGFRSSPLSRSICKSRKEWEAQRMANWRSTRIVIACQFLEVIQLSRARYYCQ